MLEKRAEEEEEAELVQSRRPAGVGVKQTEERGNGTETLRGKRANDAPFLSRIIHRTEDGSRRALCNAHASGGENKERERECKRAGDRDAPVSVFSSPL